MPPNVERSAAVESRDKVHRHVRVFAVAGIAAGQLEEMLSQGIPPDDTRLVEVILARKSDSERVTALGCEIENGSDVLHAAMDVVFRKSLLTRESRKGLEGYVGQERPIPYTVRGHRGYHEALLTVMPVRSSAVSLHEPREDNDPTNVYKICHLVHVSPDQFRALVENGTVTTERGETYDMFGHLTFAQRNDVKLTEEGRYVQKQELNRIFDEVDSYEQKLRAETLAHINRERYWRKKPAAASLGGCTRAEIVRGFLSATMVLGMQDEKMRDKMHEEKPPKAADLPTAALYLREFFPDDLPDALYALSTKMPREVLHAVNVLKYALKGSVKELYNEVKNVAMPNNPVEALRAIWPDILEHEPIDRRVEILVRMDEIFIEKIAKRLGKSKEIVRRAMQHPENQSGYLASERQKTHQTFQEHHPTNEAASALDRPFVQMLYVLGLHPYRNIPYEEVTQNQTLIHARGEIFMQVAVAFAAIPVVERRLQAHDTFFEIGLSSFLELPRNDEIYLGDVPHPIAHRQTSALVEDRPLLLWHDKTLLKKEERMVIKGFQEDKFYDDFSHNFVILDENYSAEELRDIPMRLDRARLLHEALLTHFQRLYAGTSWRISEVPKSHKRVGIDAVRAYVEIPSKKGREKFVKDNKRGERPGSFGNAIVREKFVLSFRKEGQPEHFTEVNIYPFETIEVEGTVLKGSDLIGFLEKLEDDASGRHSGERLIQVDSKDPTGPSALELVRPAAWYPSLFDTIKYHQHTPKKKKR